jgi:single-strand DNA-binding protein
MNQVSLFGRLTRDPELRYSQSGKAVVNFSLAINRYGDNNEADFFDCVVWDKQAELIAKSCKKGHRLLVWGRLQQDRWTDQQSGQNRSTIKVIGSGFSFIEPRDQGQAPPSQPPARQNQQPAGYVPPAPGGYPGQQPGYPPGEYQPPTQGGYPPPNYQGQPPANGQYSQPLPGQPPTGQQNQPPLQGQYIPFDPKDIPF